MLWLLCAPFLTAVLAVPHRCARRRRQVEIRPMMYIALTYDHRLIDGREAVGFLKRVKELVQDPARFLLKC